jgi:subtilase family serine protease
MNLMQAMNDYTYFFANFALSDYYFFNATYDHTIFTESSINDSPLGSYNSIIYTIGLNNNINDMRILEAQCPTYSYDIKILMLDFRYNMFEWGNEYLRDQEILSVCRPNRRILRDELDAAC